MRRAHLGPGQPALASRDATAGPGPIFSIRKGSFFFKNLSRSLGWSRETVLMESATHPRVTCGPACANLGITRVCVNSKSLKNGPRSDKMRILSHQDRTSRLGWFVCDQPPNCQRTRRRIAPPLLAHASGQGARPSVAGPAPRPEARGYSVDCTSSRSNRRARRHRPKGGPPSWSCEQPDGSLASQIQRTLKGSRRECRHPGLRDGADVAFSSSGVQPGGDAPGWTLRPGFLSDP